MHRIRRQILSLQLLQERGAQERCQQASRLFQEQVLPVLDRAFSKIAPPGRVIRIPKLEIDLGHIEEIRFEQEFVNRCTQEVIKQLEEQVFAVSGDEQKERVVETRSEEEREREVFRHFLRHGLLPWYAKGQALAQLEEAIMAQLEQPPAERRKVAADLRVLRDNAAVKRLFWQFSFPFACGIVEAWHVLPAGMIGRMAQMIERAGKRTLSAVEKRSIGEAVAKFADKGLLTEPLEKRRLKAWLIRWELPHIASLLIGEDYSVDAGTDSKLPSSGPSKTPNKEGAADASKPTDEKGAGQGATGQTTGVEELDLKDNTGRVHQGKSPPAASTAERVRPSEEEHLAVEYCGLVILAPYLPAFFKNLQVELSNGDTQQVYRAIHLLHYIATGDLQPEEPVLVVPKILAGMQVEEPVPQELRLTEDEKQECNNLLEAVIHNWPVLKNTSPDGLRSGFLQREGLLSQPEGGDNWLLRIDRLAQDLLLERIPWSYSVVKLPWMPWMLRVEW